MAKETKKGLGKGLGALFGGEVSLDALTHPTAVPVQPETENEAETAPSDGTPEDQTLMHLSVDAIKENPWQPRRDFDEDALTDLTESIRERACSLRSSSQKKTMPISSLPENDACVP